MSLTVPVETASRASQQIIIGQGDFIRKTVGEVNMDKLGTDGYTILTKGNDLVIAGGSKKGPLYGVYTFLEKYVGYRLYAPGVMKTPKLAKLTLPSINLTEVPKIKELRDVFYRPAMDSLYGDWHKLIYARFLDPVFGIFAHTGFQIMPPDKYFKHHPEYYAMVDGKRQPLQLDFSNEQVFQIVSGWLNAKIKNQPQFNVWSISAEDNGYACECEKCRKVSDSLGSKAAPVLLFANRMAQRFPKETISMLAYSFTRIPPAKAALAPNLNIMYCPKFHDYVSPYASASYKDVQTQFAGWKKLTKNIYIWDYIIDFAAVESIYPNLLTLKPNIQFFSDKGVRGYFAQGNFYPDGEFAELRSYLTAKLLWDPNVDDKVVIDDFLKGYYGNAAPHIKKYIELTSAQLTNGKNKLTESMINTYAVLFDQAEQSVKSQPVYLKRVQKERLPLDYDAIQYYLADARKNPRTFFRNTQNYTKFNNYLESFLNSVKKHGIKRMVHNENNLPMYQFYTMWKKEMADIRQKKK